MRTERIIHLLRGKWTQALTQFCGRRVSKCDHFVTCQEEKGPVLPGGRRGVGLSDVTGSIHPFRLGEEGGGRAGLHPQGCHLPSKKETRKGCQHPVEVSSQTHQLGGQGLCEAQPADLLLLDICRRGGWGSPWVLGTWTAGHTSSHAIRRPVVGFSGGSWARPLDLGSL